VRGQPCDDQLIVDEEEIKSDFQQSSQNSQYRNERAGLDSNGTSVKTIHEEVIVCVAHDTENCHEYRI